MLAFFGTFLFFWMFFMIRQYNGLVCYLFFELPFSYPIG
ncbi:putative membrane protein [Microcystis aeruginosa TAIHU98]|uniref:Putative membrane protein n=1 Tax=Microcystis aeruginosa TAIHU98 TaxID=1134457 RepID=L7E403_MICAE|nr:putative membrane protein [Microcystis aeruginosa TAIHU98]